MAEAQSEAYFLSRPRGSQLGAIASSQSREIADRGVLETRLGELEQRYADGEPIPRPANWGGYRLKPDTLEFWQGGDSRLHDRLRYSRRHDGRQIVRLDP